MDGDRRACWSPSFRSARERATKRITCPERTTHLYMNCILSRSAPEVAGKLARQQRAPGERAAYGSSREQRRIGSGPKEMLPRGAALSRRQASKQLLSLLRAVVQWACVREREGMMSCSAGKRRRRTESRSVEAVGLSGDVPLDERRCDDAAAASGRPSAVLMPARRVSHCGCLRARRNRVWYRGDQAGAGGEECWPGQGNRAARLDLQRRGRTSGY